MKGFGPGGIANLVKQAQKMQEQVKKAQEELENETVVADVANGMVEISMSGKKKVKSIKLKKQAVDPDDIEMLEDLLISCFNEALRKADELTESKMKASGMPSVGDLI